MKAITIKQPFASLIAAGLKEYEFRTWKTTYRGEVLIHAGKSVDREAMARFAACDLEYPLGCVIARAMLTDCVPVDEAMKDMLREKDRRVYAGITEDSQWTGYAFRLEQVEKIPPIAMRGMLGLWECDGEQHPVDR